MTKYLADNKSQATLLGKTDAHQIIKYLQQERIAENLRFSEERNQGTPNFQRKESVIASSILNGCNQSSNPPQLNATIGYSDSNPNRPATSVIPDPNFANQLDNRDKCTCSCAIL